MKLAFCLFHYFPYGGLQRDFLRVVRVCQARGHEIHVFTMQWQGERESGVTIHLIPTSGWQNHTRIRSFTQQLAAKIRKHNCDLVIGFNKMPHLDVYFAADVCYQKRVHSQRSIFSRLLPRYQQYLKLEQAVFNKNEHTQILYISPVQQREFIQCYDTPVNRFHLLPPGISKDHIAPANADQIRHEVRASFKIPESDYLFLFVGSAFKTKGLDRALKGLAALPKKTQAHTHFFIIGKDNPKKFLRLAQTLGLAKQINFLGPRDDVSHFYLAADLLLHPSYHESGGAVLLEAMAAGLPVLTNENCGFAKYIASSQSGVVLPEPFDQQQFNRALLEILDIKQRKLYQQNALAYAQTADIYSLPERATDIIEKIGKERASAFTH